MDYDQTEKIIGDLESEIDSIYNLVCLLHKYNVYNDISSERFLTERKFSKMEDIKRKISSDICDTLRRYKASNKRIVPNQYYIADRNVMEKKLMNIHFMFMKDLI